MPKSTNLNFTQNLNNSSATWASSDLLSVISVAPNSNGSNLTSGTRTFTAAIGTGTKTTNGTDATWTATVSDSRIISPATITGYGTYLTSPQDVTTNAATVDSGSSNATWALTVGILKTLYTGQTNDSVVKAINVSSFDSVARIMTLWISNTENGGDTFIGAINIPATAGTGSGTTYSIDLIGGTMLPSLPYDVSGKRVLPLKAGQILKASVPAITAAKLIVAQVIAEDY